jgi:hypothetical protein
LMLSVGPVQPAAGPWQAAQAKLALIDRLVSKKMDLPSTSCGVNSTAPTTLPAVSRSIVEHVSIEIDFMMFSPFVAIAGRYLKREAIEVMTAVLKYHRALLNNFDPV